MPVSLELTGERRTLLISGPNTGGKTVTLKTVGLLSLMAQSALPVPAAEAEFPLFEQVLADIGDYQSIEENLSTFSAHVSHIREMALDVTPDSLVLLDELGAATDPEEGGALGVAIVEHFRARRRLHAGFHAPDGAEDLRRLHRRRGQRLDGVRRTDASSRPYRLQLGLPGKSAGLEIATRLGMPEDIMRRARRVDERPRARRDARSWASCTSASMRLARWKRTCARKQAELEQREKELAREWEKRESAKLKELERRTDVALARFEEQSQEAIAKIAQGARAAQGRTGRPAPRGQGQARIARRFRTPPCWPPRTTRAAASCVRSASKKARACG